MFLYLEEQENPQVDDGDDNDRDQELEESREYCVPENTKCHSLVERQMLHVRIYIKGKWICWTNTQEHQLCICKN